MNVEELEREISQLPAPELKQFSQWFDEFKAEQWDKQVEEDILSGRLDTVAKQRVQEAIPFPKKTTLAQRESLHQAGERLDAKLRGLGLGEDELLEDFKQWRRQRGNA
ncbi:hypothetical protein SAMN02949497_2636 [Methylomagnum ishizawai]|uniref:Uncharacterized protein n=1 Tax=Methylomagnum ishizawai TaxID=1760988 RepID=A0A1Y6CY26_9GAMM|nr:hypothetical protein [Methylomagnum ishizawai]SMF95277.1 hypothetical protein SAMN02949497_2636 [Methylomagnum ishizawai]